MGTLVRISLYTDGEESARAAFRAAFARIAEIDGALSDYRPESELNRVCRRAAARPVVVGGDLFRVLAASQRLAEESGGAFDVTLGPVIRLWRQARRDQRLPSAAELREAEARSGYRMLHLDAASHTVRLDRPDMQLDLGAIGKGYAADAALAVLAKLGIASALVAASGDLAFGDSSAGTARLADRNRFARRRGGFHARAGTAQRGGFHFRRGRAACRDRRTPLLAYRGSGHRDGAHERHRGDGGGASRNRRGLARHRGQRARTRAWNGADRETNRRGGTGSAQRACRNIGELGGTGKVRG